MLRFGRLNFMDEDFGLRERFHIIFCRNVIIYFDKPTQERLMHKFCHHLVVGGYLFLGHSESLHGFHLPLRQVAPTVYQRD
jgi:chemotaxis protein methyltransferase CheR